VFVAHESFIEVIRRLLALSNVSAWERQMERHMGAQASLPAVRQHLAGILSPPRFGKSLTVVGAALYHPHASADKTSYRTRLVIDRQTPEAQDS
jgi:hypothetical protein